MAKHKIDNHLHYFCSFFIEFDFTSAFEICSARSLRQSPVISNILRFKGHTPYKNNQLVSLTNINSFRMRELSCVCVFSLYFLFLKVFYLSVCLWCFTILISAEVIYRQKVQNTIKVNRTNWINFEQNSNQSHFMRM